MAIIGGIWSDTAIAGYMGFAAICGGKAEPLPLRRGGIGRGSHGGIGFDSGLHNRACANKQLSTNNYQLILLAILPENDENTALI